jgi:hypothetical protein
LINPVKVVSDTLKLSLGVFEAWQTQYSKPKGKEMKQVLKYDLDEWAFSLINQSTWPWETSFTCEVYVKEKKFGPFSLQSPLIGGRWKKLENRNSWWWAYKDSNIRQAGLEDDQSYNFIYLFVFNIRVYLRFASLKREHQASRKKRPNNYWMTGKKQHQMYAYILNRKWRRKQDVENKIRQSFLAIVIDLNSRRPPSVSANQPTKRLGNKITLSET